MSWKRAASILALILARCGAFWVLPLGVRLQLAADGLLPSGDVQRRSLRVSLAAAFEITLERLGRLARRRLWVPGVTAVKTAHARATAFWAVFPSGRVVCA